MAQALNCIEPFNRLIMIIITITASFIILIKDTQYGKKNYIAYKNGLHKNHKYAIENMKVRIGDKCKHQKTL